MFTSQDRLLENQLALRALDKLSIAPAQTQKQAARKRREHKKTHASRSSSVDILGGGVAQTTALESLPAETPDGKAQPDLVDEKLTGQRPLNTAQRRKRRQKLTAGVLQQLGGAIAEVAMKDSRLNRAGEIGRSKNAIIPDACDRAFLVNWQDLYILPGS